MAIGAGAAGAATRLVWRVLHAASEINQRTTRALTPRSSIALGPTSARNLCSLAAAHLDSRKRVRCTAEVLFVRLLAGSLLSASALLGCSGEPDRPGSAVAAAGTSHSAAGSGPGGSPSTGTAGTSFAGSSSFAGGPNLIVDADAGPTEQGGGSECQHLNIGILGNPGARASSNFQAWLEKSGTSAQRIHTTVNEPLTAATLKPFDVLVLDWLTRDYTPEEAAIFSLWLSAGGGMMSMTGYSNTAADFHANSLLAPLRVEYGGPLLSGPVVDFAIHPVTAGLTSVTFSGGYTVTDLGGGASTRTPIAFLPDANAVAGIAIQVGKGRGIVWGDEWIEFDSEWSTLPEITQFWVQLFAWIAPKNKCELTPPK